MSLGSGGLSRGLRRDDRRQHVEVPPIRQIYAIGEGWPRRPATGFFLVAQRSTPTAMLRPFNSAKVSVFAYSFAKASSFATASCTLPYTSRGATRGAGLY